MQDNELWVIRGNRPVNWTIPVWVSWNAPKGMATIYTACTILPDHQRAMESVLRPVASPTRGMWMITRDALESIAYKTDGGNAPALFTWERQHAHQDPEKLIPALEDHDDFIDALYQRGIGKNREEVAWWWRQFCNHALSWMVMQNKTVDMGFAQLHPCPYRQNWKSILLKRFPLMGLVLHGVSTRDVEHILKASGFTGELQCGDLLAMNPKKGYMYRNIEVEHTKQWYKAVEAVENERAKTMGPELYAKYVINGVKRQFAKFTRLYRIWLAHIARPCAQNVQSNVPGMFRFIQNTNSTWRNRPLLDPGLPDTVVPNKLPPVTPSSHPLRLLGPAYRMPELRDLQFKASDMRPHRPDVGKSKYEKAGVDGVRVRDAGESNA